MHVSNSGYAIVGTPRSGTSHLCSLLTSTGVLGKPAEYLHPSHAAQVTGPAAAVRGDPWESIKRIARTDNGVFAIKAFRDHLRAFADPTIHRRLLSLPLVLVTRNDKLGQAISLARAMQTRQWSSADRATRVPVYDATAIRNCLDRILVHEAAFRQTIALHGLLVLPVVYADYADDPRPTVKAIAALVGVTLADRPLRSPLEVQRDMVNGEWRTRFVAEQGAIRDIPTFMLTDRWSRLGRHLRHIVRPLRFAAATGDSLV